MKTSFKILILFSCVLVLSACTNPLKKNETAQNQARIYSCNDLKNETSKQVCLKSVSDIAIDGLNNEILSTFDSKRCVELPQEMADKCVSIIQESGVQGPIAYEQSQMLREALGLSFRPLTDAPKVGVAPDEAYYDVAKCSQFTVPGLKEYCEKKLNQSIEEEKMFVIIEGGDVTKCDELTDESLKQSCKIELTPTPEPQPIDVSKIKLMNVAEDDAQGEPEETGEPVVENEFIETTEPEPESSETDVAIPKINLAPME